MPWPLQMVLCGAGPEQGGRPPVLAARLPEQCHPRSPLLCPGEAIHTMQTCVCRILSPMCGALLCRWCFQGLAWNELAGTVYPPGISCIDTGMPRASDARIRQVLHRKHA